MSAFILNIPPRLLRPPIPPVSSLSPLSPPPLLYSLPLSFLLLLPSPVLSSPPPHASLLIDPAQVFTTGQSTRILKRLEALSSSTPVTLQIQSLLPYTPTPPFPPAHTIKLLISPSSPNILSFLISSDISSPRPNFFIEASNRFGNLFYVRQNGADGAALAVLDSLEYCLADPARVCQFVPGITTEQLQISLFFSLFAGVIAGAASRTNRKQFNAPFLALFSPLWGMFLVSFAVGPLLQRVQAPTPELFGVIAAFITTAVGTWVWVPKRFQDDDQQA